MTKTKNVVPFSFEKVVELGAMVGFYIPTLSDPNMEVPKHAFPKQLLIYEDKIVLKTELQNAKVLTSISFDDADNEYTEIEDYLEEVVVFPEDVGSLMISTQKGKNFFLTIDCGFTQTISFETYEDAVFIRDMIVEWRNGKTQE